MRLSALSLDAVLLGCEHVLGDRAFVEQVQELPLLILQFLKPSGVPLGLLLCRTEQGSGVIFDGLADDPELARRQAHAGVGEVHRWLSACEEFIRLIDEDWYRIADYYRTSASDIHGVDIRELWRHFGRASE